jgi:hypothetical protein
MQRIQPREEPIGNQEQLLNLAAWYRELADRAGNPTIWECRLHMAEDLEAEACQFTRCEHCMAPPELCPAMRK